MKEIKRSWSQETIFMEVQDPLELQSLLQKGVSRGRIWTERETYGVRMAGASKEDAMVLAQIKLMFQGTLKTGYSN